MLETERLIGAVVLGLLWLAVLLINAVVYLLPKLLDRTVCGPSHLPVVGSLFGVLALLLVPLGTLPLRLLALPVALLPDLLAWFAYWLIVRLWPEEACRLPEDKAP